MKLVAGGRLPEEGCARQVSLPQLVSSLCDTMVDRLAEDHANARLLATRLGEAGLKLDCPPEEVETNIIFATIPAELMDADEFVDGWAAEGVRVNPARDRRIRLITHHNISADDIEAAGAAARRVLNR